MSNVRIRVAYEAGAAELYDYSQLGPDPLRELVAELGLTTAPMWGQTVVLDDRFQIRFGRYFTPMNYDQYAISNYWMPTPERSLFTTNVGPTSRIQLSSCAISTRRTRSASSARASV